jgi:hypothetical protein
MNIEEIEHFMGRAASPEAQLMTITFKKRDAIQGFIVKGSDYNDLKSKNFWRVVKQKDIEAWERYKDDGGMEGFNLYQSVNCTHNNPMYGCS